MNSFWPQKQQINCTCFNVVPKNDRKIFRSESYYSSSETKKQQKEHSIKSQTEQNKSKKKSLKKQKNFSSVPSQKYIKQKQEINKQSITQLPNNSNNQSKKIQKTIVFDYFQPQKLNCPKSQRGKQSHSYRLGRGPSHITLQPVIFEGQKVFQNSKNRSSLYFEQILSKQIAKQPNRISLYKQHTQQNHIKYHHHNQSHIISSAHNNHNAQYNNNHNNNSHSNNIQNIMHNTDNNIHHNIKNPNNRNPSNHATYNQIQHRVSYDHQRQSFRQPITLINNFDRLNLNLQLQKLDKRISSLQTPPRPLSHRNNVMTARDKQRQLNQNNHNLNNSLQKQRMQARQIQSQDDGDQISSDQISQVVGRGWDGLTQQRLQIQQLDKLNQRQTYNAQTMVTHQSNIQTSQIKTFTQYSNSFISPKSQKNNMLPFGAVHKYGMTGLSYQNIDDLGRKKSSCSKINLQGQY